MPITSVILRALPLTSCTAERRAAGLSSDARQAVGASRRGQSSRPPVDSSNAHLALRTTPNPAITGMNMTTTCGSFLAGHPLQQLAASAGLAIHWRGRGGAIGLNGTLN